MPKEVETVVKLQIPAGQATPAPPIGPVLAQHGLNIGDFTQKFNEETADQQGWVLPVEVTVYDDKSYDYIIKQPPAVEFIKKAVGIETGSGEPNKKKVGSITREQIREIAEKKMPDLNTDDIEAAMRQIEGTAKNMGLEISN